MNSVLSDCEDHLFSIECEDIILREFLPSDLITFLFEKTNTKTLNAIALTANLSSNRVILKCGFTFQNVVELDDDKYNHYTLEKEAWAVEL